jgi:hypothetical protein
MKTLIEEKYFGKVVYYSYTIEIQKRSLIRKLFFFLIIIYIKMSKSIF